MSLDKKYERHYQRNELESLQNFINKHVRYDIKSLYPEKIFSSVLNTHAEIFVLYTVDCEYYLDFRTKDKDKPLGLATMYHPTQVKNHKHLKN